MVSGCGTDSTCVPCVSQCAEIASIAFGLGSCVAIAFHVRTYSLSSIAFIGLPCPIKSTGNLSLFLPPNSACSSRVVIIVTPIPMACINPRLSISVSYDNSNKKFIRLCIVKILSSKTYTGKVIIFDTSMLFVILSGERRISSGTILMSCTKGDSSVAESSPHRQAFVCSLRMTNLKYLQDECIRRGMTLACPLRIYVYLQWGRACQRHAPMGTSGICIRRC